MMSIVRRAVLAAGLALAAILTAAPAMAAPAPFLGDEVSIGNPRAKVTVTEYLSASCPHCAKFNNEVFPALKAKYVDTGKVHYVMRELLTSPTNFAAAGFLLARCAGEHKYPAVLDALFHEQDAIYQSGDLITGLHNIGQKFGISPAQTDACIQDPKAVQAMQKRLKMAEAAGIDGTPTFLINGKKQEGEASLADLSAAIDDSLNAAPTRHKHRRD